MCKSHGYTAFVWHILLSKWYINNYPTRWTAVILERMIVPQVGNKFTFSEQEKPIPRLQQFAIRPCLEAGNSSSHPHISLHFKIHFNFALPCAARYAAPMGEKGYTYRILVGKPEGTRPLGRRRENNIKMDLRGTG
jgi:hypothetical protein